MLSLLISFYISCGSAKIETYEVENLKIANRGTVLIKVWSYSNKRQASENKAKLNGVKAVLFDGIPEGIQNRVKGRKPLVTPEQREKHKDFFEKFLSDGGGYTNYVSLSNDGSIAAQDRLKVGKQYKTGMVMLIQRERLSKFLESKKIIKGFADGF